MDVNVKRFWKVSMYQTGGEDNSSTITPTILTTIPICAKDNVS
jgi:hypothetical protein